MVGVAADSMEYRSTGSGQGGLPEAGPGGHAPLRSALWLSGWLTLAIVAIELIVMRLLSDLGIGLTLLGGLIDAGVLSLLIIPAIYYLMFRPLRQRASALLEQSSALRESEERYRSLIQADSDAIVSADGRGRIELWNAAAERMFGYSGDEAIGQELTLIIPEQLRQAHRDGLARAAVTGESRLAGTLVEVIGRRKSGEQFPVELSVTRWNSGGEVHFTGIVRDITARKRQEAALRHDQEAIRQSEQRLRTLVQAAPDAIFIQTDGRFAYLNPAALTLFGAASAQDLLGKPVIERIHPAFQQLVTQRMRELNEGHPIAPQSTKKYLRLDGTSIDVESSSVRFEFEGRDGGLIFARDITERRRAEEELVRASEFHLSLLNQAPALIWRAGLDAKCDWFNATWLQFTGRTMDQERGDGWAEGVHSEDLQRCVKIYRDAFAARRPFEMEYRLRRHDGVYRWIVDHGLPFDSLKGEFAGYIGYCFDITERREAEEALGHASQAKDEFLARLSHELRTPLTPVVLAVSQWQTNSEFPAALDEDLAMVRRNLELEARLLEDLLDVNRILHGKLPLRLERVDVHQLLRQALAILHAEIQAKQIQVTLRLDAKSSWIEGDGARVQQVFWNLLSNAAKFTPHHGGITLRSSNDETGRIQVQVTDSGRGIEPELLPRLFRPFEQGGHLTTIQYGGLGLGLTICRAVVTLHGGSISASSEGLGHGATMTVCFPTVVTPALSQPAIPLPTSGKANGQGHRVLLVEDHPDTARLLGRLVRSWGHTVRTAHSVAEALEAAAEPFDLLVSDLGLPDGTGHELMRKLSVEPGRTFRAIAVSGFGMEQDQQRSREVGFVAHLTKPVNPAELRAAIAGAFHAA